MSKHLFLLLSIIGILSIFACEELEDGSDPKPEMAFTWESLDSTKMKVRFINNTTYASTYTWNYGDGNSSTETSPTHTYQDTGSYDVNLSAYGNGGNNSLTKTIVIPLQ